MSTTSHYTVVIIMSIIGMLVMLLQGCSVAPHPSVQETKTTPPPVTSHLFQPDPNSPWALTYSATEQQSVIAYNLLVMRQALGTLQQRIAIAEADITMINTRLSDQDTVEPNDPATEQQSEGVEEEPEDQKFGTPGVGE